MKLRIVSYRAQDEFSEISETEKASTSSRPVHHWNKKKKK